MGNSTTTAQTWEESVTRLLQAYVASVERDFVVARAFQVEIDAMGPPARERRRETLRRFADHLRAEHERFTSVDPALQHQADEVYLAAVHATRQITADLLDTDPEPDLSQLSDWLAPWLVHSFRAP